MKRKTPLKFLPWLLLAPVIHLNFESTGEMAGRTNTKFELRLSIVKNGISENVR